jgi:hypothetical protein
MNRVVHKVIRTAFCLGFGTIALAINPAQAAVVVDQSSLVIADTLTAGSIAAGLSAFTPPDGPQIRYGFGQSITAGKTGYLDHLDFQIAQMFGQAEGLLTINLYDGDVLEGAANLVTSMSLDAAQVPKDFSAPFPSDYVSFNVRDSDFFVTAGQRFSVSFGFIPTNGNSSLWIVQGQIRANADGMSSDMAYNDYAGGQMKFYTSYLDAYVSTTDGDIGFRSFVDEAAAPAVPEPASWAMMIGGFALAGGALRQRRTARVIAA